MNSDLYFFVEYIFEISKNFQKYNLNSYSVVKVTGLPIQMFENINPQSFIFENLNLQKFPAVRYL